MLLLAWLMIGGGGYLMWAAYGNHNPLTTLVSLAQGKGVPDGVWKPLPPDPSGDEQGWIRPLGPDARINDPTAEGGGEGKRQQVVSFARAQLGDRYVFGAAGPDTWDCSGLTMRAYQAVGVSLPHNAAMQQLMGHRVTSPQVGDLIFWGLSSGHVGIYSGGGRMVHAPNPNRGVVEEAVYNTKIASYRSYL